MRVEFSANAWDQYLVWQRRGGPEIVRLLALIEEARRHPFTGLGKPEPLRGNLRGCWSRRITGEHRLVYRVSGTGDAHVLQIAQCIGHY